MDVYSRKWQWYWWGLVLPQMNSETMKGNIFLWFSPSFSASPHSWPALPLGGVHRGRGLPRRPLHPGETLLRLLFIPAVPQREVTRRQQRFHVLTGWRPHQHTSPGQRRGEPSHRQRWGLWAIAARQYCLIGRWTDRRGRVLYHGLIDWRFMKKAKEPATVFFAAGRD